jgi:hypothetical protein
MRLAERAIEDRGTSFPDVDFRAQCTGEPEDPPRRFPAKHLSDLVAVFSVGPDDLPVLSGPSIGSAPRSIEFTPTISYRGSRSVLSYLAKTNPAMSTWTDKVYSRREVGGALYTAWSIVHPVIKHMEDSTRSEGTVQNDESSFTTEQREASICC